MREGPLDKRLSAVGHSLPLKALLQYMCMLLTLTVWLENAQHGNGVDRSELSGGND